jgi:hypothetical protein
MLQNKIMNRPSIRTRSLAGITVPDTPIVTRSISYAREHCEQFLFNHVMRSWLFAAALAEVDHTPHDAEVLAVATVLHDLGLAKAFEGPLRFEVEGANAARKLALDSGFDDERAQLVWDGVALNSTPSLALHKESEVALCTAGTVVDWAGQGADKLTKDQIGAILGEFPRLQMKQRFTSAVCGLVQARPATTYDNFARDFGERYVPGYKAPSTVDYLLNAPFSD